MIIYALIIIAILFFLSWNLIDNRRVHLVTSLITTVLFGLAVTFAIANFSYHYGMRLVNKPVKTQRITSLSPLSTLKMIAYQPMGSNRDSQLVIYKHRRVIHTRPDSSVHNKIVKSANGSHAYVKTKVSKWEYRSKWDQQWFRIAKKPSVDKVSHVFYVPKSWKILSTKQMLAFKQIVKNQSRQLKHQMSTPQAKRQMSQQAATYVKAKVGADLQKDPKMSIGQKKRVMKRAMNDFKVQARYKAENKIAMDAFRMSETIH